MVCELASHGTWMKWLIDFGLAICIAVDRLGLADIPNELVFLSLETIWYVDELKHELSYMHLYKIVHSAYSWAMEIYSIAGKKKRGKKIREEWGRGSIS